MSSYSPPIEDVAIFDTALFRAGDAFITQSQADKRYLRFPNAQGTENLQAINVNGLATFSGSADIVQQAGSQILQAPASTGFAGGNALNQTSIITDFGQSTTSTLEITDASSNNTLSFLTNAPNNTYDPLVNVGDSVIAFSSATAGTALTLTNTNSLNNNTNGLRLASNFIVLGYGSGDPPANRLGIDANGINVIGALVTTQGASLSVQNTSVAFTSTTPPTSAQTIPAANDSSTKIPTTAWVQSAISAGGGSALLISNNTWTGTQNWTNTSVGSLTSSATQPASNDSSTKIPTTAWVQSAIASIPAATQFVPKFVNYTDVQTTSGTGYSSGPQINFGGTWGINDIAYVRVTSQISYNNTGSGYLNTGNTSGLLYFRPYYMSAGWAPVSGGSVVIYTQNIPGAQMGAAQKPAYYVPSFNVGTIGKFCLNAGTATSVRVSTLSPETTGGWELFVSLEYLGASTSAGTLTFSAGAGTNITNNVLP